jgi:serine/threonine-protein kinase RsbW
MGTRPNSGMKRLFDESMDKAPLQSPGDTGAVGAVGAGRADGPVRENSRDPAPPAPPPPPLRLELTSDTERVAPARKAVEAFARQAGLAPSAVADLGLVVNEALANVIRHAYRGEGGRPISLAADCDGSELRLTIRDWGSGENPAALPARPRDPATPGGLGLLCLRALVDHAEFAPQPDGMLLTIVKKRAGSESRTAERRGADGDGPGNGGAGNDPAERR